jgi:hypothetical protein
VLEALDDARRHLLTDGDPAALRRELLDVLRWLEREEVDDSG